MRRSIVHIMLGLVFAMLASASSSLLAAPAPQQGGQHVAYLPLVRSSGAIQPPAKPRITSFIADPASIAPGGSTTMRWSVSGATSLRITPAIGAVGGTSVAARPAATTTYTLIASNSAGQASATAKVTVTPGAAQHGGFFTHREYLTYNAATAVDAQGGIHLAFSVSDEKHEQDPTGQPALYTYCPGPASACADPSKWSTLVNLGERVNQVQIAVTPDGRPRTLVRQDRTDQNWSDYIYYACEQQCTDPSHWAGLLIAQPAGVELFDYYNPQHDFALDSQGRPRFVYANGWGNGQPNAIHYAYCDAADCTEPGSWSIGKIMSGPSDRTLTIDYASLAFAGDKPRIVTRIRLTNMATDTVYFECDQDCDQDFNWSHVFLLNPNDNGWDSWDLAVDADGHPRVALYEPAPVDIHVGGKLYYAACDKICSVAENWQLTQVTSGEGKNVDLAIDPQGRTHLVYDAGQRGPLAESWCDAGCEQAARWQRRILETSEQLMQEFAPASPFTCNQQVRAWVDGIPSVAFDSQGKLVVAYDTRNVAICYYTDPNNPDGPPLSEVNRLWWAVRWAYFARP
jgi:hypothetical protein